MRKWSRGQYADSETDKYEAGETRNYVVCIIRVTNTEDESERSSTYER